MIHHVWGLLTHPNREWQQIRGENETVSHFYGSHVLVMSLCRSANTSDSVGRRKVCVIKTMK